MKDIFAFAVRPFDRIGNHSVISAQIRVHTVTDDHGHTTRSLGEVNVVLDNERELYLPDPHSRVRVEQHVPYFDELCAN